VFLSESEPFAAMVGSKARVLLMPYFVVLTAFGMLKLISGTKTWHTCIYQGYI
jgi:hypothetical protein